MLDRLLSHNALFRVDILCFRFPRGQNEHPIAEATLDAPKVDIRVLVTAQ